MTYNTVSQRRNEVHVNVQIRFLLDKGDQVTSNRLGLDLVRFEYNGAHFVDSLDTTVFCSKHCRGYGVAVAPVALE